MEGGARTEPPLSPMTRRQCQGDIAAASISAAPPRSHTDGGCSNDILDGLPRDGEPTQEDAPRLHPRGLHARGRIALPLPTRTTAAHFQGMQEEQVSAMP